MSRRPSGAASRGRRSAISPRNVNSSGGMQQRREDVVEASIKFLEDYMIAKWPEIAREEAERYQRTYGTGGKSQIKTKRGRRDAIAHRRRHAVKKLWEKGKTGPEIARMLSTTEEIVRADVYLMRKEGDLPPSREYQKKAGSKSPGRPRSPRPWAQSA